MVGGKDLYLFDFDGTLTNRDTMFDFLKFSFPKKYHFYFISYIPIFILTKLKILSTSKVKQSFIASFLKNKSEQEIKELSKKYFESRKDIIFHPKALKYINDIPKDADKYIVTASMDLWVRPFVDYLGFNLLSSEGLFENSLYTGRFKTPNCNKEEKVNRIVSNIQLSLYENIYVFGDTKGDKDMLEIATHPHFRYFE